MCITIINVNTCFFVEFRNAISFNEKNVSSSNLFLNKKKPVGASIEVYFIGDTRRMFLNIMRCYFLDYDPFYSVFNDNMNYFKVLVNFLMRRNEYLHKNVFRDIGHFFYAIIVLNCCESEFFASLLG